MNGNITGPVLTESMLNIANKFEVLSFKRALVLTSSPKSIGYLQEERILETQFVSDNSIFRYYDVPQATYEGLMAADSQGYYYHYRIRSNFNYKKVYDGK